MKSVPIENNFATMVSDLKLWEHSMNDIIRLCVCNNTIIIVKNSDIYICPVVDGILSGELRKIYVDNNKRLIRDVDMCGELLFVYYAPDTCESINLRDYNVGYDSSIVSACGDNNYYAVVRTVDIIDIYSTFEIEIFKSGKNNVHIVTDYEDSIFGLPELFANQPIFGMYFKRSNNIILYDANSGSYHTVLLNIDHLSKIAEINKEHNNKNAGVSYGVHVLKDVALYDYNLTAIYLSGGGDYAVGIFTNVNNSEIATRIQSWGISDELDRPLLDAKLVRYNEQLYVSAIVIDKINDIVNIVLWKIA